MSEKILHICEVCDRQEELTSEEAFNAGWDYPPHIGAWGIVSPRTCMNCSMSQTAWWALMHKEELTDRHRATIVRIVAENHDTGVFKA